MSFTIKHVNKGNQGNQYSKEYFIHHNDGRPYSVIIITHNNGLSTFELKINSNEMIYSISHMIDFFSDTNLSLKAITEIINDKEKMIKFMNKINTKHNFKEFLGYFNGSIPDVSEVYNDDIIPGILKKVPKNSKKNSKKKTISLKGNNILIFLAEEINLDEDDIHFVHDKCNLYHYLLFSSEGPKYFRTMERITEFVSNLGNNDTPYPLAFSQNTAFFLMDHFEAIEKKHFKTEMIPENVEKIYAEYFHELKLGHVERNGRISEILE